MKAKQETKEIELLDIPVLNELTMMNRLYQLNELRGNYNIDSSFFNEFMQDIQGKDIEASLGLVDHALFGDILYLSNYDNRIKLSDYGVQKYDISEKDYTNLKKMITENKDLVLNYIIDNAVKKKQYSAGVVASDMLLTSQLVSLSPRINVPEYEVRALQVAAAYYKGLDADSFKYPLTALEMCGEMFNKISFVRKMDDGSNIIVAPGDDKKWDDFRLILNVPKDENVYLVLRRMQRYFFLELTKGYSVEHPMDKINIANYYARAGNEKQVITLLGDAFKSDYFLFSKQNFDYKVNSIFADTYHSSHQNFNPLDHIDAWLKISCDINVDKRFRNYAYSQAIKFTQTYLSYRGEKMADFFKLKSKHYERLEEIKAIFGNDDLRMTKLFYYLKGYDMTNYERFQNYIDKGIQGLLGDLDQKNLEKSLLYKYQQTYIKNIEKFVEQVNNFNNLYNIGKSIYLTTKLIKQKYNEIQDEIDKKKEGLK